MPEPVFITLGSNIQPAAHLRRAAQMLGQKFPVPAVSRVYESAPVNAAGGVATDQDPFLNAAVLVLTDKPPAEIKFTILRFLETMLGRIRTSDKFAPRTIDLDLALYGDLVIDSPRLTLPDPDILTRAHVALPLADLVPDFRHPITGQTLGAIAASLGDSSGITVRDDLALFP